MVLKPEDVIYAYTDSNALEDGVLADVSALGLKTPNGRPVNRITASIAVMIGIDASPGPKSPDLPKLRAMVAACDRESKGWFIGEYDGTTLWLVDNEVGGYTLMLPEDN
jgi:hypothetical protein